MRTLISHLPGASWAQQHRSQLCRPKKFLLCPLWHLSLIPAACGSPNSTSPKTQLPGDNRAVEETGDSERAGEPESKQGPGAGFQQTLHCDYHVPATHPNRSHTSKVTPPTRPIFISLRPSLSLDHSVSSIPVSPASSPTYPLPCLLPAGLD